VRFNIPDVPGLRDSSAIVGDLCELDSAVVMHLSYSHWAQVRVSAMLVLQASFDCYHVSYIVRMWSAFSVFTLIVFALDPCKALSRALWMHSVSMALRIHHS